jgi:hypothetical protein
MANIVNNLGQVLLGFRSPVVTPVTSTLLTSLFGVWNGDTTTTTLATGAYGAWNADGVLTSSQLSASMSNMWQGGSTFSATNYATITASMSNLWKAENNANDSIGSVNGTMTNGATFSTGKLGTYSFLFDGVNDYVALPTGSLEFTGDFTVSMWVNATNWSSTRTLINAADINSSGNHWNGWYIDVNTYGKVGFYQANNGTFNNSLYSNTYLPSGIWSLLTVTRTSTTSSMYINGSLVATVANTISIAYSSTNYPTIGVQRYLSGSFQEWFLGNMDEIGTWTRALTANEILGLYNGGTGQTYPYSSDSVVALDSFGTINGTLQRGTTFSTGIIGNALSFTASSFVDLPAGTLNMSGDFSVSLWVYPTVNNGNMTLISSSDTQCGWQIQYVSGNLWFWGYNNNATPNIQVQTGHSIALNTWTHVLVTFKDGNQVNTYINGSLTNTVSITGKHIAYDYYSTYYLPILGAQRYRNGFIVLADQQSFFTGKLDGIGLWNRVLTSTEALALYNNAAGNEYPFAAVTVPSANDSVGSINGSINGGVSYATGVVGNAFTFNGSTGYISLPSNSLNFSGDFSLSVWVKIPSAPSSTATIFSNSNYDVTSSYGYILNLNTNRTINFVVAGSVGTSTVTSNTVLSTNTWYLITVVRNSTSKTSSIYVNGTYDNQATNTNLTIWYDGTRGMLPTIGAYYQNNQGTIGVYQYLNGTVDSVTMWNKQLSVDEITQLYNIGSGTQYPFTSPTYLPSASDSYGTNNGTLMNGCTFTTGLIGKAFTFDGVNDYVQLPNNSFKPTNTDFSISAWVNFSGTTSNVQTIFSAMTAISTKGYGIILYYYNNALTFQISNASSDDLLNYTSNIFSSWHLVTVTRKAGSSSKIYLDGTLVASNSLTNNPTFPNSNTYPSIGGTDYSGTHSPQYFCASGTKLDAVTVWNKELTSTEVTTLYNSGAGKQYPNF